MNLTMHGWWTVLHGFVLGAVYLIVFAIGLLDLLALRQESATPEFAQSLRRLKKRVWAGAVLIWLMAITGTYVSYPWYRAPGPGSPKSKLLAVHDLAYWHTWGMEWKEHLTWAAPMLATVAGFIVSYYGAELATRNELRKAATTFFVLAFAACLIGGVLGMFIYKAAPIL